LHAAEISVKDAHVQHEASLATNEVLRQEIEAEKLAGVEAVAAAKKEG